MIRSRAEPLAYAALAAGLAALLWRQVAEVRGFYLDEWVYLTMGEYMWEGLPASLWSTDATWQRGPQRLYPLYIGLPRVLLSPGTAFGVAHALGVLAMVSAILPAALLARRMIGSAPLRVLAVALAVAVPWLSLSAHLLTETLAFPLFVWMAYLGVRAADAPTARNQLGLLGVILLLTLCRLNLAFAATGPALAVLVDELRRRDPLRVRLRRRWPLVAGAALALLVLLRLLIGGRESLGAYGGTGPGDVLDRLFGGRAGITRQTLADYGRGIVQGVFVLPFALGAAAALAAGFGRLGPRLRSPALIALGSGAAVFGLVAVFTQEVVVEERYVFYPVALLALFAVAALEHGPRVRWWLPAGAALALWLVIEGTPAPAADAYSFFARPGGAFWMRVVDHRVDLGLQDTRWLVVAGGLGVAAVVLWLRPRVLVVALGVCLAAQVLATDYDLRQELRGTVDVPGGLAVGDEPDVFDDLIPDGQRAGIVPATLPAPGRDVETLQVFNRDPDFTVVVHFGTAAASFHAYVPVARGADGVLTAAEPVPPYLIAMPDDPSAQFRGEIVARPEGTPYALQRGAPVRRALWSASVDRAAGVRPGEPVVLALDRAQDRSVRFVDVTLQAPAAAAYELRGAGRRRPAGSIAAGGEEVVRLRVPPCPAAGPCPAVRWTLRADGPGTPAPVADEPGRVVSLLMPFARLVRG